MASSEDVLLAQYMADVANSTATTWFSRGPKHLIKDDGSPVSDGDLAVEEALLEILADERPDDGVLTEESGVYGRSARRRWILDPIDGTRSYLAKGRSWGTHIALEIDGRLTVAMLTRPTEAARWWALCGGGAYVRYFADSCREDTRLKVSNTRDLKKARIGGLVDPGSPGRAALAEHAIWVKDEVSVIAALIEGRIDAVLDDGGNIWDQAPAVLLVQEAGGFFVDPHGGERFDLGWGLYGNLSLRDQLDKALSEMPMPG